MAQDRGETAQGRRRTLKAPLVAFDFDGTLTVRDSFVAFLRWRSGRLRYALGLARLAPAGAAYLFHRDRGRIKAQAVNAFLKGAPRSELEAQARAFAQEASARLFRPDALAVWRRWRAEGARLIIVSASPSAVVAPFAEILGADALIATELAYDDQACVTGAFATPNCRGPEKVVRLRAAFGPKVALEAAYGDTSGDKEMLELAQVRGYRVFKGRPKEAP